MALPFADSSFDAAVMALVLVFVPDPAKGVSEMVRVVVPGGAVVTYMWACGVADFRSIQSTPRYRQWALYQRAHHEWMRLEWKHYETGTSAQVADVGCVSIAYFAGRPMTSGLHPEADIVTTAQRVSKVPED